MWLIRLVFWGAVVLVVVLAVVFVVGFAWCVLEDKKRVKALSPEEQKEYYKWIDEVSDQMIAKRKANKTSVMQCPLCRSSNVSVMGENKKSFSFKKAIAGNILIGRNGSMAGFAGKKIGYDCYCGDCKHRFLLKDK